jgi:hypothetical protein
MIRRCSKGPGLYPPRARQGGHGRRFTVITVQPSLPLTCASAGPAGAAVTFASTGSRCISAPIRGSQSNMGATSLAHPGAAYVEVDGEEHIATADTAPQLLAHVMPFLQEAVTREAPEPDKVLATVLFSDIVGSTARAAELGDARWRELLAAHHGRVRAQLARFRGVELDTAGDGFFARFDGPARAIRCALAIRDAVREIGIDARLGLHWAHSGQAALA